MSLVRVVDDLRNINNSLGRLQKCAKVFALVVVPDALELLGVGKANYVSAHVTRAAYALNLEIFGLEAGGPLTNKNFPFSGIVRRNQFNEWR